MAVQTPEFGLITGRITSIAFDPSDPTGNHVYVGTTGGGVWSAQNVAGSSLPLIVFTPLTDSLSAFGGAADASISIGALTVQPANNQVILAGTGDPNDLLDLYFGAGILRSTDGGTTWNLIFQTSDLSAGLSSQNFAFTGEGFAGFAWSTVNPQLVVAAVSQADEGDLQGSPEPGASMEGLYYSSDSGASWHLATITDGDGMDVQGPDDRFAEPDGNAATAVVWNPVRKLFIAAVRYHGYYQSQDGVTWTRLSAQPGPGLNGQNGAPPSACPTYPSSTGSIACPIFRGALAVNPATGDTFAWSVDRKEQDSGIWQDECAMSGNACANPIAFAQQWSTAANPANPSALVPETTTPEGSATIVDGKYNLALAAVPVPGSQETMVLAGANDLWRATCPLAMGPSCAWRNTTNSIAGMCAQVAEFQHVVAWPDQPWLTATPTQQAALAQEILIGNDSGLWRSLDAIGETGSVCNPSDASHFQNLNGGLGSLAEVQSISPVVTSPYAMMAGLGALGTAGVKAGGTTANWPQILGGYGGPVAADSASWFINDQAGVAIYQCAQSGACIPADFGTAPAVSNQDVSGDGDVMPNPAAFLVDPADSQQLLVATCRVWRGPASGGWSPSNEISPILDTNQTSGACQGNALIRSIAATATPGGEVIYVGMYGSANGGADLPGHVLAATFNPTSGSMPVWRDLTSGTVGNDSNAFNFLGFDISSITIDPHDSTGNTLYATIDAAADETGVAQTIYRSIDGGLTWNTIMSNLPDSAVNAVAVDPQSANTVYVATDVGVYYTTEIATCAQLRSNCWSTFGTGLPNAPVMALSAAPAGVAPPVLVAATYGRGIWQSNLWSAGTNLSAAAASPGFLNFTGQAFGTASAAKSLTLINTGSIPLVVGTPTFTSADFGPGPGSNCANQTIPAGGTCVLQVVFTPAATGQRTGQMIVYANVYGGQLAVDLNGIGLPSGSVSPSTASLAFGQVAVGSPSSPLSVTLTNSGLVSVPVSTVTATAPFLLSQDACSGSTLAPSNSGKSSACVVQVELAPTQTGSAAGLLTFTDASGAQSVALSGTGAAPATDTLTPTSLAFGSIASGQISAAQSVTIANNGDLPLQVLSIAASANFQSQQTCQQPAGCPSVAAHSTYVIGVQFAPTQAGALAGTLTLVDALGTKTVPLSGTGLQPAALTVTPSSLAFPQQQPGVASAPKTLTITNSGGTAMANIQLQFTGPGAADYSLAGNTCGASLSGGAQCTAQVVFTPQATGSIAAALTVSSSTTGVTAASVPLNGSGQLASGLQTNPAQLPFATAIPVGQTSASQSVTITNASQYSIGSISVTAAGPFSLSGNTCSGSLGAGAQCTTGVVFTPNCSGAAAGTLTVTSADVAAPATVALSATGFDFTVTPSGSTSQTVTSGQQADYKLLITPNGAAGAFTFQCGTLPANALCIFNPASQNLSAGVQGNVVVEIYTGNSGLSARAQPLNGTRGWPLALAVVLLPLAFRRRRGLFFAVLFAAVLAVGLSSCTGAIGGSGGGSGGQGGSASTPAGTYSIPVSISASGMTQSVTLTLVVD